MVIEKFAWAPMIPRDVWLDKEVLYGAVLEQWGELLREAGGFRLSGPLYMKVLEFGRIDDITLEPVIIKQDGPRVKYVVVLITGPAMHP